MAGRSMVAAATCSESNAKCFEKSRRARCMENNFPHSITSPLSNEPAELLVRLNSNSLWSVYVLDDRRPRPRSFSLHIFGHIGAIRPQPCARKDASACRGELDMVLCVRSDGAFICSFD